ncbi:sugar phosphate isomerase/epimerase family protein [Salinibacterium hongtaonis]|uniref:Xylose isomerase n=1 Tax=Homoserinimonas hongtaonis TaxID=2079791 RepID=A0A2U1T139_9MICO|nr:TIM barrel protein [Salinibacterium hongtaonis]PWB97591.1 xylose isomerase [Salinibacterium hongtaonis]
MSITVPTRIGIAPLSAVTATAREYLEAAARARFDFVGLRLSPVTAADVVYTPGNAAFAELKSLVADSGLDVFDIEVFSLTPQTRRDDWLPLLEMTADLGASLLNIVGDDPDSAALTELIAELCADSAPLGITPVIEPIAYRPMNSYSLAVQIARATGCAVELDALHVFRTGTDLSVVTQNRDLFPILQLCDAPAEVPIWGDSRPAAASPVDEDMLIESRFNRLLPGRGAAPLAAMREAVAPGTPVALEVPNLDLQARYSVDDYFALLHQEGVSFVGE